MCRSRPRSGATESRLAWWVRLAFTGEEAAGGQRTGLLLGLELSPAGRGRPEDEAARGRSACAAACFEPVLDVIVLSSRTIRSASSQSSMS